MVKGKVLWPAEIANSGTCGALTVRKNDSCHEFPAIPHTDGMQLDADAFSLDALTTYITLQYGTLLLELEKSEARSETFGIPAKQPHHDDANYGRCVRRAVLWQ